LDKADRNLTKFGFVLPELKMLVRTLEGENVLIRSHAIKKEVASPITKGLEKHIEPFRKVCGSYVG
jgi:hypothetical protein